MSYAAQPTEYPYEHTAQSYPPHQTEHDVPPLQQPDYHTHSPNAAAYEAERPRSQKEKDFDDQVWREHLARMREMDKTREHSIQASADHSWKKARGPSPMMLKLGLGDLDPRIARVSLRGLSFSKSHCC